MIQEYDKSVNKKNGILCYVLINAFITLNYEKSNEYHLNYCHELSAINMSGMLNRGYIDI